MPKCPACDNETSVHHKEDDGRLFLMCGHIARTNPNITADLKWHGLFNGKPTEIDITGQEFVPAGDIVTSRNWKSDACPSCGELECAHTLVRDSFGIRIVEPEPEIEPVEQHTRENTPERGNPTDVAQEFCICGRPDLYKVSFRPQGVMTCGHGYIREPNKPARLM